MSDETKTLIPGDEIAWRPRLRITVKSVPESQLIVLLCPSCRKQANCPLLEGGRFVCSLCGWEGHQDDLVAEQAEETRETPERVSPPPSGPPGGELHEPRRFTNRRRFTLAAGGVIDIADFEASSGASAVVLLRGHDLLLTLMTGSDCGAVGSELLRRWSAAEERTEP